MAERLSICGRFRRGDIDFDLDLSLPAGRIAVVGPNGSGKSSLLRLIAGLEALDDGQLTLDGTRLDHRPEIFVPPHERPIAMSFQEPRLFSHLRVIDNVAYPLRRAGRPLDGARIHLDRVGAGSLADLRPTRLSGGQAHRVALARALAADAPTLLLDEPLAAIDEAGRDEVGSLLRSLNTRRVLWVTHDPADTGDADVIVSIRDGVVRQTAT
ncbi:MAG: ABC transporter [Acidimicrobiaceae bacterium]|nr:ABC transporter [Acidimicrobiaceae bacterium]HAB56584.1 ABC transporter [Acidimicrobiaceae bacterium]